MDNLDYYVNTDWCKTVNKAMSKIDFEKIDEIVYDEKIEDRNTKEEILDLVDMAKCVMGSKTEVNNDRIRVYRNNKLGWKIEIFI